MAKDVSAKDEVTLLKELAQKGVSYARKPTATSWSKTDDGGVIVGDPNIVGGYVVYTWDAATNSWDKGDNHCAVGYAPNPPAAGGGPMDDGLQIVKPCKKI